MEWFLWAASIHCWTAHQRGRGMGRSAVKGGRHVSQITRRKNNIQISIRISVPFLCPSLPTSLPPLPVPVPSYQPPSPALARSATGNQHHLSHSGWSGLARKVGIYVGRGATGHACAYFDVRHSCVEHVQGHLAHLVHDIIRGRSVQDAGHGNKLLAAWHFAGQIVSANPEKGFIQSGS